MMKTFADRVIDFNRKLDLKIQLPAGIKVMNPFVENPQAFEISSTFYRKYYNDNNNRQLILGINPGRFGAGITGVPFTDTKRMEKYCGINVKGVVTHETSSVFIYELIEAYGGPVKFYSRFYINSPSPLGFLKINKQGKEVNYNYYDDKKLLGILDDFIVESIKKHLKTGVNNEVVFCLGTGKNYRFLKELNSRHQFFKNLIPLEHPRYIMQYKSKEKENYIRKYLEFLKADD